MSAHPLLDAIAKAQYDLTSAQAWLAEVRRQVAALNLVPVELPVCEHGCGPLHLPPTTSLEDHYANVHEIERPSEVAV